MSFILPVQVLAYPSMSVEGIHISSECSRTGGRVRSIYVLFWRVLLLVEFMVSAQGWTAKVRYSLADLKVGRKVLPLKPISPLKI